MYRIKQFIYAMEQSIKPGFFSEQLPISTIASVLLAVTILSIYQFVIYRYVSKRSFYSKHYNIAMALIPFFISTIVLTLQTNLIITLGTIGALSIIRFRTAIKDPLDMVYLLWSLHTGIVCGAQRYELAIMTSIIASILMFVLDLLPMRKAPYLLILKIDRMDAEQEIMAIIRKSARYNRVKSRSIHADSVDMIIELSSKNEQALVSELSGLPGMNRLSLVAHDGESIV